MDILYLATSNVSIWALIFHGDRLLFWRWGRGSSAVGEAEGRSPPGTGLGGLGGWEVIPGFLVVCGVLEPC